MQKFWFSHKLWNCSRFKSKEQTQESLPYSEWHNRWSVGKNTTWTKSSNQLSSPLTSAPRNSDKQNWPVVELILIKCFTEFKLMKARKPSPVCEVDIFLKSRRHCVLRLPHYNYCDNNPIELVCRVLKNCVVKTNTKYTMKDLQVLGSHSFKEIGLKLLNIENNTEKNCKRISGKQTT